MITVNHKHILRYTKWDYNNKPNADLIEEGYDVEVFKSGEKVADRIKELLGNRLVDTGLYLQLFSGTLPDKSNLLDRSILLSWDPVSQILQLTLPFSTIFVSRSKESDKYDWLIQEFRSRITDFHAQISKNPHWLTYLNSRAFSGADIK